MIVINCVSINAFTLKTNLLIHIDVRVSQKSFVFIVTLTLSSENKLIINIFNYRKVIITLRHKFNCDLYVFVFVYEFLYDVNWNINFIHYSHFFNNNKYDCKISYNNLKIIAKNRYMFIECTFN